MIEKSKRVGREPAAVTAVILTGCMLLSACAALPRGAAPGAPEAASPALQSPQEAASETATIVSIRPLASPNAPAATLRVLGIGPVAQAAPASPAAKLQEIVLRRPDGRSFTLVQPEDASLRPGALVQLAGPEGSRRVLLKGS